MKRNVPLVVGAAILYCVYVPPAQADTIPQAGDFTTYTQVGWGDPAHAAGLLLAAHYDTVYASSFGVLEVGVPGAAGFSIAFGSASSIHAYLPATVGTIGPLTADLVEPTASVSGPFGGEVLALHLNVDFSRANHLAHLTGVFFGDLLLANFSGVLAPLNGRTVADVLSLADTLLGGGAGVLTIAQLHPITEQLNASFAAFDSVRITAWAQDHLRIANNANPIPEPSTAGLALLGLVCVLGRRSLARQAS